MQKLCLRSAEGLAKMTTVIVAVFEAAGLTVSEKTETMLLRTPDQQPRTSPLVMRQQARGIDRQRSSRIWAVWTQAPTLSQRSNYGSDSHWHATVDSSGSSTKRRLPVHSEGAHAKGRGDGDPAIRVCNVFGVETVVWPTAGKGWEVV